MTNVALINIAIGIVLVLWIEKCTATAEVITTANSNRDCHCHTELKLTVPPCVCTGMTEALQEVNRLKSDIRELRDKCSTVNTNLTYACKYIARF